VGARPLWRLGEGGREVGVAHEVEVEAAGGAARHRANGLARRKATFRTVTTPGRIGCR
jgi:hypothetical protein